MNWKNWNWKEYILFIIVSIFVIIILQSIIFLTTPTKAEVESFLKVDKLFNGISRCDPYATKTDYNSEYSCTYYLRKHTALVFGQIINAGFPLCGYTPFGYFNYDPTLADPTDFGCALTDSCKNDDHYYVLVVTRDEGPLVYNPINGDFMGRYNDLMREMGCDVQPYEKPFFPIQPQKNKLEAKMFGCYINMTGQLLDTLRLNSTDKG
ncbi:MAG: hypothetical protein V2A62_01380 [Candidatus Woesearchaeota archaeon]